MKIGLVLPGFSADERDWCIPALLNFVRQFAAQHSVHVFALEYPYRRETYSVYGATVRSMGGRNRGKMYAPRLWLDTLSAIYAEHRRAPFDLLHAFWVNEPGAIAVFAGKSLHVPLVASPAGGELVGLPSIGYGGQLHWLEKSMIDAVMRRADRITVGSHYMRQFAARWRTDVAVLPLGVDIQRFARGPIPHSLPWEGRGERVRSILKVGSLVPVKGHAQLLRAFAGLGRQDVCLEIAGRGILEDELRALAQALGIADRVSFLGDVPHDALLSRYRMADWVVQSSLHEAQGMAVLEAVACGKPIVGTPVGILPELAATGGAVAANGFTVDDLKEAMEKAIAARTEIGENARRLVERRWALEETWNGWMELYQSVH